MTEDLTRSVLEGFLEDQEIIVAQQRSLDLDLHTPMLAMRVDTALASFRTLLDDAMSSER